MLYDIMKVALFLLQVYKVDSLLTRLMFLGSIWQQWRFGAGNVIQLFFP
jgi:hypothetical protein